MTPSPNADQIAYWNSAVGERWVALQRDLDDLFLPLTRILLARVGAAPGDRVVDVGCGCGATTLDLARAVAADGAVFGVDVSEPMLEVARRRAREAGLRQARFALADASTHGFDPESSDLVVSRFGVMFFDDPAAAFANLRRALKPGGRLVFACWRPLAENGWFDVALQAALAHLPQQPTGDPHAPGPFAFADPDRVRTLLAAAGFSAVEVTAHDAPMRLAGPGDVDAAVRLITRVGPTARLLAEADPDVRGAALDDVRKALAAHDGPDGVVLGGAIWIAAAQNGTHAP